MLKNKKSGSGILLTKINQFNNLRIGNAYNKNYEKISHLEFEIERQKEVMVKLKLDLSNKNKELNELISKNKNENNNNLKKIRLIEEIIKIHKNKKDVKTNHPKLKIDTEIDENVINTKIKEIKEKEKITNNNINTINDENETYNKTNTKTFYTTNNNFTNKNHILPKIKSPRIKTNLFINTNTFMKKKKIKDILYMNTLKDRINILNEKLEKKQEEILDYKTKLGKNNYSDLENDLNANCEKLKELKYKNAKMCSDLEDFAENYFLQREENLKLKNRLNDFIDIFNNYKENTEKSNLVLEKKLKYYEDKNLECLIYHSNLGKNSSKYHEDNRSKLTEAENLIEKINEEIEEINNEIKSKNDNFNLLEESNKKNKEKENKNKNLKKEYKEKKNKYKNLINKIKEAKELVKQKDEEIIKLKEEIKKLKASKNVFYY